MPMGRKRSPNGANARMPKPMLIGMETTAATRPPATSPGTCARQLRGKSAKEACSTCAAWSSTRDSKGLFSAAFGAAARLLEARPDRIRAAQLVLELADARHRGGDFARVLAFLRAVDDAV